MRLFTCILIPNKIKLSLLRFQDELSRIPLKGNFVEKDNLHITITFLGEKNENETKNIMNGLNKLDANVFRVQLDGIKIIPRMNNIKIIGISVKDHDEQLKDLIEKTVKNIGGTYHLESKLTLCRVSKIFDKNEVLDFLRKNQYIKFGEFEVNSINLMESTLTKNGLLYKNIFTKVLK
ncbi:MAG: RNA 2',3'-cyclic phosphodiesterase [Candidatus Aenigmarchaeota archaeon]|nr:RNA 2',3'-cyclic phosphodiesterase [Candidatus Aenigmarchaeota archaeon]